MLIARLVVKLQTNIIACFVYILSASRAVILAVHAPGYLIMHETASSYNTKENVVSVLTNLLPAVLLGDQFGDTLFIAIRDVPFDSETCCNIC